MSSHHLSYMRRRQRYSLFIQLGLVVSMSLLLLAFKLDWYPEMATPTPPPVVGLPVIVDVMPLTDQKRPTPPPARPQAFLVVPDDTPIGEEVLLLVDGPLPIDLLPNVGPTETDTPDKNIDETFLAVEEMPAILGGPQALYEHIQYPEMARRARIEGRVILQFIVDEEGRVVDPVVLKGIHPLLDEAALDALRQVTFSPGRQRGKTVKVRMSLPVTFQLR